MIKNILKRIWFVPSIDEKKVHKINRILYFNDEVFDKTISYKDISYNRSIYRCDYIAPLSSIINFNDFISNKNTIKINDDFYIYTLILNYYGNEIEL